MQGGLTLLPSPCSSQVAHSLSVTTNKMGDLRYYAQVGEGGRGQEGWEGHTLRCLSNLLASQGACTLPLSHLCITPPPPPQDYVTSRSRALHPSGWMGTCTPSPLNPSSLHRTTWVPPTCTARRWHYAGGCAPRRRHPCRRRRMLPAPQERLLP